VVPANTRATPIKTSLAEALQVSGSEVFLAEDYVLEVLGAKSPFQLGFEDGQAY